MKKRAGLVVHWIGFLLSCFMLCMTYLDPSQDEIIIHLIASLIPNTSAWFFAWMMTGKSNYLPFLS